jgi:hypothetical protein
MNRTAVWSVLAALALVALGAAWFFSHYERVPTLRWERPGREALRDPYLALDRFAARLGRPLARIGNAARLEELPPGGVLLLDRDRRIPVNPRRTERLFEWVEAGGYLIVAAEPRSVDDPLLERLGVWWTERPNTGDGEEEEDVFEAGTDTVAVRIPGQERLLDVQRPRWPKGGLKAGRPAPDWRAGPDEHRGVLLHYRLGRGHVTVLEDFGFFTNTRIGEADHAELVWTLIRRYGREGELRLATRLEVPTLWHWLAESAWMALWSGAGLILAWLWARVPRFGGVLPTTEPERRSLKEHLAAVGRAVWRAGGLASWLEQVRQDLRSTLTRRHPHLAGLPAPERNEALARLGGVPPQRVASLLSGRENLTPEDYTEIVRTAQTLEKQL